MGYTSKNYFKHTHPSSLYQYSTARFFRQFFDLFCMTHASSVLEMGSGEGFVLDYLAKRKPDLQITGIDINLDAVSMADLISARAIKYACANGMQLPFRTGAFDIVILSEVLEHINRPEEMLIEAVRVSQSFVLVTVPLEPYFRTVAAIIEKLRLAQDPDHIQFWTSQQFQEWLECKLDVVRYETCDLYQLALCTKRR